MTITFSHRLSPLIIGCAVGLLLIACASPSQAQSVAVMVNGDPITTYDIEQRSKLIFLTTHKTLASIPPAPMSINPTRR
jgi:peptidyl-prolyl cis-trans isomerase SurA